MSKGMLDGKITSAPPVKEEAPKTTGKTWKTRSYTTKAHVDPVTQKIKSGRSKR